jgi:hypothetical protein
VCKGEMRLLSVNGSMDEQNKAGENGVSRTVTVYSVYKPCVLVNNENEVKIQKLE